ncbi:hypothetical protein NFJ02_06g128860 [Pycnococcus provasolii]
MRVRVSSLNAQAHLSSLLETSVEARLNSLRGESADASKAEESAAYLDALRQRLADMQTCILASLERSLATQAENTAEGMSGGQNDDERNGSAASGALPQEWELADEDLQAMPAIQPALGELAQIEEEVAQLAQRCASMRESVPQHLLTDLDGELASLRPSEPLPPATTAAEEEDAAADGTQETVPSPAALRQRLRGAVAAFPSLRAKLEAALERLQRVVNAVESRKRTVAEEALAAANENENGEEERPAGVSPAFKDALKEGKINTRKRLASRELKASLAREGSMDV